VEARWVYAHIIQIFKCNLTLSRMAFGNLTAKRSKSFFYDTKLCPIISVSLSQIVLPAIVQAKRLREKLYQYIGILMGFCMVCNSR
jgi:hypothetical protein